jgi:ACS family hexuronate transporter-like MFS transporter
VVIFGGIGMLMLLPTIFTSNLFIIAGLFGFATMSYSAFSTMANVLPSDLFRSESVATISGMGGAAAGLGTIVASKLIGHFSDANQFAAGHSFDSIVIVAGLVPFAGMILVLLLVRNTKATEQGFVRPI